jgi:DNA-binding SARP family transcriptional activator
MAAQLADRLFPAGDDVMTAAIAAAMPLRRGACGPSSDPPFARLRLFDGFEYEHDGHRIELPLGTQRVVAFLAVHERPMLRGYVAGCLWLDKPTERANANLRSALWRLRRPASGLVECRGAHVGLGAAVDVDLHHVQEVARAQLDGSYGVPDASGSALLGGDLLPDWYDEWVVVERERVRQLRLHALESLCVRLTRAGRYGEAIDVGLSAIAAEPLRESAHRVLVAAHLAEGNVSRAAHQYVHYRDLVWDALGVEPSARLTVLIAGAIDLDVIDTWGRGRAVASR